MKKYIVHITVWGLGIIICLFMTEFYNNSISNYVVLWGMCALFFVTYYVCTFLSTRRKQHSISQNGVFSGRAFGIFVNIFVVQYIMELYQHIQLCAFLLIGSGMILFFFRKDIVDFFTKNNWKFTFYWIYLAFNILLACIDSVIGCFFEGFLMVNIGHVETKIKIILMLVYLAVSFMSVIPNSFIMRIATKNE